MMTSIKYIKEHGASYGNLKLLYQAELAAKEAREQTEIVEFIHSLLRKRESGVESTPKPEQEVSMIGCKCGHHFRMTVKPEQPWKGYVISNCCPKCSEYVLVPEGVYTARNLRDSLLVRVEVTHITKEEVRVVHNL